MAFETRACGRCFVLFKKRLLTYTDRFFCCKLIICWQYKVSGCHHLHAPSDKIYVNIVSFNAHKHSPMVFRNKNSNYYLMHIMFVIDKVDTTRHKLRLSTLRKSFSYIKTLNLNQSSSSVFGWSSLIVHISIVRILVRKNHYNKVSPKEIPVPFANGLRLRDYKNRTIQVSIIIHILKSN